MIQEFCTACGAVGHDRRGHRVICDGCGGAIEDHINDVVSILTPGAGRYSSLQIHLHKRCSAKFQIACNVCGAEADRQGVVLHDFEKHRLGKLP